jgi:hypothetical protein
VQYVLRYGLKILWEHSLCFRTQKPAAHVRSERIEAFEHS